MKMRRVTGVLVAVLGVAVAGLIFASCQAPGSVLRGRLTTTTDTHVAGVAVTVYAPTTDDVVARTTTDSDGDYSFLPAALPDGTYKILFASNDWWKNATSLSDATPVTATAAAPAVINATVNVATGSVSGTVTNTTTSAPAAGVTTSAISTVSGSTIARTTTASNGTYSFTALPVGSYVFRFTAPGLATRYNNSALTQPTAPVITVTGDSVTTGIDTTVAPDATITGIVTNGTNPAADILAVAYNPATGNILAHTATATDGTFTITGLNDGAYTVGFGDPTGHLQPLIYGSASLDPTTGTTVTPTGGTINIGTITLAPYTVADAPTAVTATAGDSQATVSWTAPDTDGGSTITGYTVTASTGQTCDTTGATTCVVTGLANGTAVTFTVTATNTVGRSNPSDPSTAVIPATVPDAPTAVTATAATGQATVTWTAPDTDGGSTITGYTVTASTGQTCGTTGPLSCVVTGLPYGTNYTFTVTATNIIGTSTASTASTAITVVTLPDAPTGLTATVTSPGYVILNWTAPANDGGSPILNYSIHVNPTPGTGFGYWTSGAGTPATSYDTSVNGLGALPTDTPIEADITAYNAVGRGVTSTQIMFYAANAPAAPQA